MDSLGFKNDLSSSVNRDGRPNQKKAKKTLNDTEETDEVEEIKNEDDSVLVSKLRSRR